MSDKKIYLNIGGKRIEVSREVYLECCHSADKERYFMKTLKQGHTIVNPEEMSIEYIPAREISYESLIEAGQEFPAPDLPVDEMLIKAQLMDKLEKAMHILTDKELDLIQELFYLERTEREAAEKFRVSQNTIHHRKNKILGKLKRALKKFF